MREDIIETLQAKHFQHRIIIIDHSVGYSRGVIDGYNAYYITYEHAF